MKNLHREKKTLDAMLRIYCRGNHGSRGALCGECLALSRYAHGRLDGCAFGENKPACSRCPTHCYKPAMRQQVIEVMRYAGPRMAWRHPFMALSHLLKKLADHAKTSRGR